MARRWTELCARSRSSSPSASGVAAGLGLSSIVEDCWRLLCKPGREFGSGQCSSGGGHSLRRARIVVDERLERGVLSKFSPRFCSRIAEEFGCYSRKFSSIGVAEDFKGTIEETLNPRKFSSNRPLGSSRRTGSSVKRPKERCFDDIIEKEKMLKIVLNIKDLLGAEPSRSMTLLDLGKSKDDIGFKGKGRLVAFLKRYPGVFRVHETAALGKLPWFQFTPEAEVAFEEELDIRKGMDNEVVTKLRKLLMMSSEKTLALSKIAHLGRDLGLPDDFRSSLVHEYPMYFRVVGSKDPLDVEGPKLELVRWSTRLAVTEVEMKAQEQQKAFRLGEFVAPTTWYRLYF